MAIELAKPAVGPSDWTRNPGKTAAGSAEAKRRSARKGLINCPAG
jgi:hypothetical protein